MANLLQSALSKIKKVLSTPVNSPIARGFVQGVQRIQQSPEELFMPTSSQFEQGIKTIARPLQRFPSTQVNLPRQIQQVPGFNPIKLTPYVTAIPGEMIKSYGRSLENIFTKEGRQKIATGTKQLFKEKPSLVTLSNPAVESALDLSDFVPLGGLAIAGVKSVFDARQIRKILPEIRAVKNMLETVPKLDIEQFTAIRSLIEKINPGISKRLAKLPADEYESFVYGLIRDAEYAALNPELKLGLGTRELKGKPTQPKGVTELEKAGIKTKFPEVSTAQTPQNIRKVSLPSAPKGSLRLKGEKVPLSTEPEAGGRLLGGAGKPPSTPSISDNDLISKITKAIKEARPVRGEQEKLYTKARGQKLARLMSAREKMVGEKGFYEELGALRGELPKAEFESIRTNFTQENVDRFFNMIKSSEKLDEWDKINAQVGLQKLLGKEGSGVPTKGELEKLYQVFGKDFTEAILSKRPLIDKLKDLGMQLYNLPRSTMTGIGDFSGTLLQNILFAYRHPVMTGKNFVKQVEMFASEKAFNASQTEIAQRANYQAMKQAKVSLTEVSPIVTQREEAFMASLAEKIPGVGKIVRATGRAWTGFLNRMRADVFDQVYDSYKTIGGDIDDPNFLKSLGEFVNAGTGRGSLGKLERSANILSQGMFSARKLAASAQMINPAWYLRANPYVRKEALKTMLAYLGGGMAITSLADLAGAEVGKDPTSADFGKIKIGNTRFNVWGTYQQVAVLMGRLWKGYATSSTTGRKMMLGDETNPYAPNRLDLISRFFESKEHPTLSLILGAIRGTNQIGQPFSFSDETLSRFVPMVLSDGYDLWKEHGDVGLLGLIPSILGIPTQTYGKQIPTIKTTSTGKVSIKLKPTGGLAEDIITKITGREVSNLPQSEWLKYVQAKEQEIQQKVQMEELKDQLEKGQLPTMDKLDFKNEDVVKLLFEYSDQPYAEAGDKLFYKDEEGSVKTLNLDFEPKFPKLTGNELLDTELISDYKGEITKAKNAVMKAFDIGYLTQDQAFKELAKLKITQDKLKKPKKPKQPKFVSLNLKKTRKKLSTKSGKKGVKLVRPKKILVKF